MKHGHSTHWYSTHWYSTHWLSALLSLCLAGHTLAGASPWVDISLDQGQLLLETEVAGIAGVSLIDTGANINGINRSFVSKHGLDFKRDGNVQISGVYGLAKRVVYDKVPASLFGQQIDFRDIVEINLGDASRQLILGAQFLELFIFQFDYPNSRMRMLTRDSLDLKKLQNLKTKRDASSGMPLVRVGLNGERNVWLTIDTGNSGGLLLERNLAARQKWLDKYPTRSSRG